MENNNNASKGKEDEGKDHGPGWLACDGDGEVARTTRRERVAHGDDVREDEFRAEVEEPARLGSARKTSGGGAHVSRTVFCKG